MNKTAIIISAAALSIVLIGFVIFNNNKKKEEEEPTTGGGTDTPRTGGGTSTPNAGGGAGVPNRGGTTGAPNTSGGMGIANIETNKPIVVVPLLSGMRDRVDSNTQFKRSVTVKQKPTDGNIKFIWDVGSTLHDITKLPDSLVKNTKVLTDEYGYDIWRSEVSFIPDAILPNTAEGFFIRVSAKNNAGEIFLNDSGEIIVIPLKRSAATNIQPVNSVIVTGGNNVTWSGGGAGGVVEIPMFSADGMNMNKYRSYAAN